MNVGTLDAWLIGSGILFGLTLWVRWRAGFGWGQAVSRDDLTLRSRRYGLVGRPDRIVRKGRQLVVEDKKAGTRLYDSHRAQMGVYMLLVEDCLGKRPSHAVVVLGNGRREIVKNTQELRALVLDTVAKIRSARSDLRREQEATPSFGKCRACAQRGNCQQRV